MRSAGPSKPDFICVGPEKTGTSWLYCVLEHHPQVWLPPYKELRFLNDGNLIPEHSLKKVLFSSHWHYRSLRRVWWRNTVKLLLGRPTEGFGAWDSTCWLWGYMLGKHDFAWYMHLFPQQKELLCGDITPNYYELPERRIAELKKHCPNLRVLLLVRDPIARAWSKACMLYCEHGGHAFESIREDELIQVLDRIYAEWHPYLETIALWQRYYPDMKVSFFDDVQRSSVSFYREICDYLGLAAGVEPAAVSQVIGKGVGHAMPARVLDHLKQQYQDEIRAMAGVSRWVYPRQWLEKYALDSVA